MYTSSVPRVLARRILFAVLALCTTAPAAARAQEVLTEVSAKQMTKIITSMGLEVGEAKRQSDSGDPPLQLELASYRVLLFLANDQTDAQLYVGFRKQKVTPDKINEWNRKHRFARAYRNKDGNPVLEADIDFTGGVTEANIKAWIRLFRDLTTEYAAFVR